MINKAREVGWHGVAKLWQEVGLKECILWERGVIVSKQTVVLRQREVEKICWFINRVDNLKGKLATVKRFEC